MPEDRMANDEERNQLIELGAVAEKTGPVPRKWTGEEWARIIRLSEVAERTGAPWWLLLEADASVAMSRRDDEEGEGTHTVG